MDLEDPAARRPCNSGAPRAATPQDPGRHGSPVMPPPLDRAPSPSLGLLHVGWPCSSTAGLLDKVRPVRHTTVVAATTNAPPTRPTLWMASRRIRGVVLLSSTSPSPASLASAPQAAGSIDGAHALGGVPHAVRCSPPGSKLTMPDRLHHLGPDPGLSCIPRSHQPLHPAKRRGPGASVWVG